MKNLEKNQRGFILVTVVLYLAILSLLAFSLLEANLLEIKSEAAYRDKIDAFYMAESYLDLAEKQICNGQEAISSANVFVERIPAPSICEGGVNFYRLTAVAEKGSAKVTQQSTVAMFKDNLECLSHEIKPAVCRQSFIILNGSVETPL